MSLDPVSHKLPHHLQSLRAELHASQDLREQRTIIREIEQDASSAAVIVLMERLFSSWGMGILKRTINALVRLHPVGGLLGIAITLPLDVRFYHEKLGALAKGAKSAGNIAVSEQIYRIASQQGSFDNLVSTGRSTLTALSIIPFPDIAYGSTIARIVTINREFADYMFIPQKWLGNIEPSNPEQVSEALDYAERRVPGISTLLVGGSNN